MIREIVFDDGGLGQVSAVRLTVDGIDVDRSHGGVLILHDNEDIVIRQRRKAYTGERVVYVELTKATEKQSDDR